MTIDASGYRLDDLVRPTPVATFVRDFCGRRFFHATGPAERFHRLLTWTDLNLDGEPHRVGELMDAGEPAGREERRELLAYLCRHDLLAVVG